jgi:tRNAThr (cytosine32-N3)-methyltransferase
VTLPPSAFSAARALIDEAHRRDPATAPDGRPAELLYADRMEAWVVRLEPDASQLLRLAARCQHLERWVVPREDFPMDRQGYNAWRRSLYRKQADRARDLFLAAGFPAPDAESVATWVSKTGLLRDPGTQALEDAACLVFFEFEIEKFAAQHGEYSKEKFLTILRRIWRKMSEPARAAALGLALPEGIGALLREATDDDHEDGGNDTPTTGATR